MTRTAARWSRKSATPGQHQSGQDQGSARCPEVQAGKCGSISGSMRRFAPFRDIPADTGFEYVHRIGRSYFERKRS
jgi:hypothetical protein